MSETRLGQVNDRLPRTMHEVVSCEAVGDTLGTPVK
jgi:hypothetical protein